MSQALIRVSAGSGGSARHSWLVRSVAFAAIGPLLFTGCGGEVVTSPEIKAPPPPAAAVFTSIAVSPASLTLVPSDGLDTATVVVVAYNQRSQQMQVAGTPVFSIAESEIATVDQQGRVRVLAAGSVALEVAWTAEGVTRSAIVPVSVVTDVHEAMAGVWEGANTGTWPNGSQQTGATTLVLFADGSVTSTGASGSVFACAAAGKWVITAMELTANIQETACQGTIIAFKAPLSTTRIIGTWAASSGASGTSDHVKK